MNNIVVHIFRFLVFVLIQSLVLNSLEIGLGIQLMIYPLFIILLPFETTLPVLLLVAFVMGFSIDSISNTFGLHTSSLLLVAYLRPFVFNMFSPREGYDPLKEASIFEMGQRWFISVFGILLLIQHLWFFTLEMFNINEMLYVFQKTILSAPLSFLLCILLQVIFVSKPKER
ncbi:hypothetical protein N9E20_00130 [Crocinitomicaceae bacterium]|jgi:hypothetical protein|nr:hypothetical protein [Crocinitomicaceae bacterium]